MDCNRLLDNYLEFFKKELKIIQKEDVCEFKLPFPQLAGDMVYISITRGPNNMYLLSDKGALDQYMSTYGLDIWNLSGIRMKSLFDRNRSRYNILTDYKPSIVIESTQEDLTENIFQMSNILNELQYIKYLSMPGKLGLFKRNVSNYLMKKNVRFIIDPSVKIEIHKSNYSFKFDYLLGQNNTYSKIITSDRVIRRWGIVFDQIKKYYQRKNSKIEIWIIFNDKSSIDSHLVYDFLTDYTDEIIAWSKNKSRLERFRAVEL